jgi:signal transduction histidine kinase
MHEPVRYRLLPIDAVTPIDRAGGRWCGQVLLPGEDTLHTVIIEARGGSYVATRPSCRFDGWRGYACPMNEGGERLCSVDCHADQPTLDAPVVRIRDDFFVAVDSTQRAAREMRQVLLDEINALREANQALEEQVLAVSRGMDQVIAELSEQSSQLAARGREQERLSQFVKRVMDTMDSMLIVVDRFGRIARLNAVACQVLGCTEAGMRGRPADDLLSPADRAVLQRLHPHALEGLQLFSAVIGRGGLAEELELAGVGTAQPGPRPVFLLSGSPLYDPSGKLEGIVIVATDVSRLRERERALEESEQRFRDFASMSTTVVWRMDAQLRFIPVEADDVQFERVFAGHGPQDFMLPEDLDGPAWRHFMQQVEARQPFVESETRIRTRSGIRWFLITGRPVFEGERFIGYRGVAKDLTDRHAMEEELRQHRDHLSELVREQTADLIAAKEAAEQSSRLKSEFLSNVSHELRTPLHSILSFSRLGLKKLPQAGASDNADKLAGYFERILASGGRLTSLVDDLLNLAKLESGRVNLALSVVNLGQLVDDTLRLLEAVLASRGQRVVVDNQLEMPTVRIDPNRIVQVLLNLLGNASKFSPAGGLIELRLGPGVLASGAEAFRLAVADRGPGIPETELEDVFGSFVQSTRTKSGAGGTGLGLAICRQIVLAHGGTITAANRNGGGALFELMLPTRTELAGAPG